MAQPTDNEKEAATAAANSKDTQPTGATGGGTDNPRDTALPQSQSQQRKIDISIKTEREKGQGPAKQQAPSAPQAPEKKNGNDDKNENDRQEEKEVLKPREDDRVSSQDHKKCEEAFKAANIDNLDDTQLSNIYKYEYNLIKMAGRGQDKESSVINIATEKCGLGKTDADLLATELIDRFGKSQSNAQAMAAVDSIETMKSFLTDILPTINEYCENMTVRLRTDTERQKSRIKSDCCAFPLPFWEEKQVKSKSESVLKKLIPSVSQYRKKVIGIYGSIGVGKSAFVDYLCNKYNPIHEKFYLIPVSLNDKMGITSVESSRYLNASTRSDMYFQSYVGRIIFSYFLVKETNNISSKENAEYKEYKEKENTAGRKRSRSLKEKGFDAFMNYLLTTKVYINWDQILIAIESEISQLTGKTMFTLVDDVSGGIGDFDEDGTMVRDFIKTMKNARGLSLVVCTFRHGPNICVNQQESGKWCDWKGGEMAGVNVSAKLWHILYQMNPKLNKSAMGTLFSYFGLNTRCFGVLYYIFLNINNPMVDNGREFKEYCEKGDLSNMLKSFITLWNNVGFGHTGRLSESVARETDMLLFVICVSVFGINQSSISMHKEAHKSWLTLQSMGMLFMSTEKKFLISPVIMRLWTHVVSASIIERAGCGYRRNFLTILKLLFSKLDKNDTWNAYDYEDLIQILVLLRLNAGKFLSETYKKHLVQDKQVEKTCGTLEGLLFVKGPLGEAKIDYGKIEWEHLNELKFFGPKKTVGDSNVDDSKENVSGAWFAGIENAHDKQADVDMKILTKQTKDPGCVKFHRQNLDFDLLVILPLILILKKQGHEYLNFVKCLNFVEIKSKSDNLQDQFGGKSQRNIFKDQFDHLNTLCKQVKLQTLTNFCGYAVSKLSSEKDFNGSHLHGTLKQQILQSLIQNDLFYAFMIGCCKSG